MNIVLSTDQDLTSKPNYLVTFTVGYNQMKNIDAAVKKVSSDFNVCCWSAMFSC